MFTVPPASRAGYVLRARKVAHWDGRFSIMVGSSAQSGATPSTTYRIGSVAAVDTGERTQRAQSFGANAHDYDRYRPRPPEEAVEWLLPRGCRAAVDIGAGTGALTRLLVGRVPEVIAVEPDARMRAVLADAVPGAVPLDGRAEALPLGDASVDGVLGSSMWHWVDEPAAVAEAARVLRPGGVLGVLWSGADRRAPWIAELLGRSERGRGRPEPEQRRHREVHLPPDAPFGAPETMTLEWTRPTTVEALIRMVGTYSGIITMSDTARAEYFAALDARARELGAAAADAEIQQPMRCFCWRAVRLPIRD
jgi:SAM-dependent methyltransferase